LLVGRPAPSPDFAAFAARAWDLDALSSGYRAFIAEFEPRVATASTAAMTDKSAFVLRTRLVHAFREFPLLDPELPGDVTQLPGERSRAVRVFHRLYRALQVPAQRHFDAAVLP
jgi:phenylacetic acid degradation operon negative regulatory protein